ncbi:hypothetical protein PAMC26577_17625 [Caballeronia sordidicola]|uniref:Uncharacterized protein n=1 Tax=Caballeronia sordidicola TaxID=196367 RepID=A0A242MR02_CABSO|nr:hypothetical protein PAMC26577_17625 [Caballeronia sordidicola]
MSELFSKLCKTHGEIAVIIKYENLHVVSLVVWKQMHLYAKRMPIVQRPSTNLLHNQWVKLSMTLVMFR